MNAEVAIAAIQFDIEDSTSRAQVERNVERMITFIGEAAEAGAQIVVFPELANTGYYLYGDPDALVPYAGLAETIPGPTTDRLGEAARKHDVWIVAGVLEAHPTIPAGLFNTAVLIDRAGQVVGRQQKMHLGFDDRRVFFPGSAATVFPTELGNVGMLVCYDAVFPESARMLALQGAEIIISIFAGSTRVPGGQDRMNHLAAVRSRENGLYFVVCSRVGRQGERVYVGGSTIASPSGEVVEHADHNRETVVLAHMKNDALVRHRQFQPALRDRRPELYADLVMPHSELTLHRQASTESSKNPVDDE